MNITTQLFSSFLRGNPTFKELATDALHDALNSVNQTGAILAATVDLAGAVETYLGDMADEVTETTFGLHDFVRHAMIDVDVLAVAKSLIVDVPLWRAAATGQVDRLFVCPEDAREWLGVTIEQYAAERKLVGDYLYTISSDCENGEGAFRAELDGMVFYVQQLRG